MPISESTPAYTRVRDDTGTLQHYGYTQGIPHDGGVWVRWEQWRELGEAVVESSWTPLSDLEVVVKNDQLSSQIMKEVELERQRQWDQWGTDGHSISQWMLIISKHVGRLAYYGLEWGTTDYPNDIPSDVRKQAIKVAALCVALIEDWCVKLEGFGKKW